MEIPIHENLFQITFQIWNKTTSTQSNSTVFANNSNIVINGDPIYTKLNNSNFSTFVLDILWGNYSINVTLADSTQTKYTVINFTADSIKTVRIEYEDIPLSQTGGPCTTSANCVPNNTCTSNLCYETCVAQGTCATPESVPKMNTYYCDYAPCNANLGTTGNQCYTGVCNIGNHCISGMCYETCVKQGSCVHDDHVPRINTYFCDYSFCSNQQCGGATVQIIDRLHGKCLRTRQPYNGTPSFDTCDDTNFSKWTFTYVGKGTENRYTICNFQNDCLRGNPTTPDNTLYLSSGNIQEWAIDYWPDDSRYNTLQEYTHGLTIIAGTNFDGNAYHQAKDNRSEGKWKFNPPCNQFISNLR